MHSPPLPLPLADVSARELGQRRKSDGHKLWPELVRPIPLQMRFLPWILTQVLKGSAPFISVSQAHCEGGGLGAGGGIGDGGGGESVLTVAGGGDETDETAGGGDEAVEAVAPQMVADFEPDTEVSVEPAS